MAHPFERLGRADYQHLDTIDPAIWSALTYLSKNTVATVGLYDSAQLDAFARLRVSNPVSLFSSQHQYDLNRMIWENVITDNSGNAAVEHSANMAEVRLNIDPGDEIIRQTRRYFRYQPGKSQLILTTFNMSAAQADLTQEVGYFDGENGIFLRLDDSTLYVVRRSNSTGTPTDFPIAQSQWNIDPMDGSGPSGYTLDITKAQIFIIDLEWLGVGRVRVGFVIDGIPYYVHQFLHANVGSDVYMTTANLPVRYHIVSLGTTPSPASLSAICANVTSEGGFRIDSGFQFSASNGVTLRAVTNGALLPLVAIRPKLTFNSIVNRGHILLESLSIFSEDVTVNYGLWWGATVTGGSWASLSDDSITEYNITATSFSGGIRVDSGYVAATANNKSATEHEATIDYPVSLDVSGAHPTSPYTDTILIAAISTGVNSDCGASLEIRELR